MIGLRETVPDALDGERLDRALALLASLTRAEAARLVDEGRVTVAGSVVTTRARRLVAGEVLEAELPPAEGAEGGLVPDPTVDVTVVHADDAVVVVDKQPGLVVHPGAGHPTGTLVHGLLARFPEIAAVGDPARPGVVHRLDRGTSGLLVVARRPDAYDSLVAQLRRRQVERAYLTLVRGHPDSPTGMVDAPVGRSARQPTRMAVTAKGKEARTRFEVERTFTEPAPVALLECRLETGRTHQVRVHLAAIGHPVVGDSRYGGTGRPPVAERPLLHAARLGFDHPATGERMTFEAPLPPDFEAVLAQLS